MKLNLASFFPCIAYHTRSDWLKVRCAHCHEHKPTHKHRKEQQLQNIHTHIQIDGHTHFEWGVEPSSRIKPKAGLKTPLPYQITTVAHNPQSSMSIICSPANLYGLCHFQGTFHSPDLPTIHIKHNKGIITLPPPAPSTALPHNTKYV